MMEQESRNQFEDWYQTAGISNWVLRFNREPDGRYSFVGTENHWRAWQASRKAMTAKPIAVNLEYGEMPNVGHGHVFTRADGVIARCGGPGLCRECASDSMTKSEQGARFVNEDRGDKK